MSLWYSLVSAILIIILWSVLHGNYNLVVKYISFLFLSSAVCICIYTIVDSFFKKLIIHKELMILKKLASSDIIYYKDIAGFKQGKNEEIEIIHIDSTRDPFHIPIGLENHNKIKKWLSENFNNLDKPPIEFEIQKELLENPLLGHTMKVREERLKEINQITKYFNWAGMAVSFWVMLYPTPYELSIGVAIIFPIAVTLVAIRYEGLVKIAVNANKFIPSLSTALIMPGIALSLRALLDLDVVEYFKPLWVLLGIVSVLIGILIGSLTKEVRKIADWPAAVYLSFMLYLYSFGTYMAVNCVFDTTPTREFKVRVVDKTIKEDKRTTYYLTLDPWGPKAAQERVSVSASQYEHIAVGDTIFVNLSKGRLKTSWFSISRK